MGESVVEVPGLASSLALSFLCLACVCLLAYGTLRWLSRRGIGRRVEGAISVVARCPLEPRRSVYLLKTGGRCFLVGVGEGPMSLLAEVDPAQVQDSVGEGSSEADGRFGKVLARILGRARS
jgi:flagellar biosynthetic protein FliO